MSHKIRLLPNIPRPVYSSYCVENIYCNYSAGREIA